MEQLSGYDAWKAASPPEPPVVGRCAFCGDEITLGENVYDTCDGVVHADCFFDFAKMMLNAKLIEAEAHEPEYEPEEAII